MDMKTPGVYVQELSAFTNSVVEVATAVPVFIGFTERARRNQQSLAGAPTRIASLAEYVTLFGGAPTTTFDFEFAGTLDLSGQYTMVGAGAGTRPAPPAPPPPKENGHDQPPAPPVIVPASPATPPSAKPRFFLFYALQLYFLNGGGPCYILSVGGYDADPAVKALLGAFPVLELEQEPTLVVMPDAVSLASADWTTLSNEALLHCSTVKSRFAILDVFDGFQDTSTTVIADFRNSISNVGLDYGAAYYPWVQTAILSDADIDPSFLSSDATGQFVDALKTVTADPSLKDKKTSLDQQIDVIKSGPGEPGGADGSPGKKQSDDFRRAHNALRTALPAYKQVMSAIKDAMNLLPPSAGMAGVYARIDSTRGVFKAPAGTGILGAIKPAVNLTNDDQEDLNVPLDGKAINAIRSFPGSGIMVWGARTLDGNSQDFRYINVRRTLIMLEQSIMIAAQAYVFEPNTSSTWVAVKSAIDNFLTNQWSAGALAGATPAEAFSVAVGLPSTMTGVDILDGYMRVSVKVAIVRPAEFIIITFQQQMQTS